MTIEVKPNFTIAIADDPAATAAGELTPSRWNLGHKITQATLRLLGRVTAGAGDTEELTAAQVKTFLGLGSAADANTGTASGQVPVLDSNGQLATSVLPALALTDVFEVGSQAAMLALTAQRGDIAIRTDLNKTFALATDAPGTLADWKELRTPTDVVLAVAGLTGTITAAQLKTSLAIAVADITDASANGRSLIQAANYAAMFGLLKVAATTSATGVVELATTTEASAGTDTTRAVTPAGLAAWGAANASGLGQGQTWQVVTRVVATSYQNTAAQPIGATFNKSSGSSSGTISIEVSVDNAAWVVATSTSSRADAPASVTAIIPPNHYYRYQRTGSGAGETFVELR